MEHLMLTLQTLHDGVNAANVLAGAHEIHNVALIGLANIIGYTSIIIIPKGAGPNGGVIPPHGLNLACGDPFVLDLVNGLTVVIGILTGLGVAIAVIGIVVGGLMRATAWGSEQRIATSNKAIVCAVIGLVVVLLGVTLGNQIPAWFGLQGSTCSLSSLLPNFPYPVLR